MSISFKATVIFDFDSTIIKAESLELILAKKISNDKEKQEQIKLITDKGMSGQLSFGASLQQRLAIAAPSKNDIQQFADEYCPKLISNGFHELIKTLQRNQVDVWILSGGFQTAILPFADYLNIPKSNVHAVELNFANDGSFIKVNPANKFNLSKFDGSLDIKHLWRKNSIVIGDGFTDYQLYQKGLTKHFVAYCEHVQRKNVLDVAPDIAFSCSELKAIFNKLKILA